MHKTRRCSFANLRFECPPQDDVMPNDHKTHNSELTLKTTPSPICGTKCLFHTKIRETDLRFMVK